MEFLSLEIKRAGFVLFELLKWENETWRPTEGAIRRVFFRIDARILSQLLDSTHG